MMPDQQLKYPEWQIRLDEVLAESDVKKLPAKIHDVETLISERLRQLDSSKVDDSEREAINTALNILRVVKRERLGFPDWN
jgi:hypothetical protein